MKQHEREFFISLIRTGNTFIKINEDLFIVKPLTIDQSYYAAEVYNSSLNQAYVDGMMTEDEMDYWMRENDLWTDEDDTKTEGFKKDLEKLKIEIYNARNNDDLRERIRKYIRIGETQFSNHLSKKHLYYQNTAEGYANTEKIAWSVKNSTYFDGKLYDFSDHSLAYIVDEWQASFLKDNQIRELARNEPWKSLWIVRNNTKVKFFSNDENSELTYNQKNLIIWSQMYDNIQESLDCPSKEVIDDDDVLDGWFIIQSKKREQEKAEQDLNNSIQNDKIKNASEVFVVANNAKDISRINNINNPFAKAIKKQRENTIMKKGSIEHHNLLDQKQEIQMQQTQSMRGKFIGG